MATQRLLPAAGGARHRLESRTTARRLCTEKLGLPLEPGVIPIDSLPIHGPLDRPATFCRTSLSPNLTDLSQRPDGFQIIDFSADRRPMKSPRCSATLKLVKTNRFILYLGVALLAAGCKREEGIRTYNAPKDPPPAATVAVADEDMDQEEPGKDQWTAPLPGRQVQPPQMATAAYQVSDDPPLLLTISEVVAVGSPPLPH